MPDLEKEAIMDAFSEAVDNVMKDLNVEPEAEENKAPMPPLPEDNPILPDEDGKILPEETATDENEDNKDVVDIEVAEKVDEKVEEAVDKSKDGKFNFLGISIDIKKNDDGQYDISLSKDGKTEDYTQDDVDLNSIFNLIDGFFQNMVLDDNGSEEKDDEKEEDKPSEENKDDDKKESDKEDKDEKEEDKKDDDKEEDKESVVSSQITEGINDLKVKYSDKIAKYFELGTEAKNIALDMVADTILANSVQDLVDKGNAKDELLASKKIELKDCTKKYLLARKIQGDLDKFYNSVVANLKVVEDNLSNKVISKRVADKTLDKYNTIISNVLNNIDNSSVIISSTASLNRVNNILLASIKKYNDGKAIVANNVVEEEPIKENNVPKRKINSIVSHSRLSRPTEYSMPSYYEPVVAGNRLNSDGMIGRMSLSERHGSYDEIEEMSAEIMRIAGFDKDYDY